MAFLDQFLENGDFISKEEQDSNIKSDKKQLDEVFIEKEEHTDQENEDDH